MAQRTAKYEDDESYDEALVPQRPSAQPDQMAVELPLTHVEPLPLGRSENVPKAKRPYRKKHSHDDYDYQDDYEEEDTPESFTYVRCPCGACDRRIDRCQG